ncbi:hypothetical protein TVAG_371910 [Trichomonas vaginalis G3]|uniref:Uncharacterized protein n=1 Tax=Trichomonas vaginalis (strain ATCC PRA-98 / G3) TaxID=412133 RepID=A2E0W2_TRIV3|nr:hypothetical protein TVAGG3_0326170 [Trichomonas vaginalis G3]EAY13717.1 hypothetical protein TVAG_371910 [Trichomonas vaginalis G3]KAI5529649.1 hypothetical protein TVAGG3_0326170 [Trichomonas vaginalis G3]|eukprot:XP_001325940.1 hypothetical protein [Trichomonas vaginalis G3]
MSKNNQANQEAIKFGNEFCSYLDEGSNLKPAQSNQLHDKIEHKYLWRDDKEFNALISKFMRVPPPNYYNNPKVQERLNNVISLSENMTKIISKYMPTTESSK